MVMHVVYSVNFKYRLIISHEIPAVNYDFRHFVSARQHQRTHSFHFNYKRDMWQLFPCRQPGPHLNVNVAEIYQKRRFRCGVASNFGITSRQRQPDSLFYCFLVICQPPPRVIFYFCKVRAAVTMERSLYDCKDGNALLKLMSAGKSAFKVP